MAINTTLYFSYYLDPTYYTNPTENSYYTDYLNFNSNVIIAGDDNNLIIYKSATAWVRPRFINTNPDPNNQDIFEYRGGIGTLVQHQFGPYLHGKIDTTFLLSIYETYSGEKIFGTSGLSNAHIVEGKLTRNGITKDTIIPYNAPPFDTTIVEIRY